MKTLDSSKGAIIRHESELALHFREFLPEDPDLRWHLPLGTDEQRLDHVEVELDSQRVAFRPVYELKPSLPWLASLKPTQGTPPLLVTPELSHRVLDACKQHGIAAIDLNGRAWLRAPGLLVDRRPLLGRSFSYELEPRNIFVGKSARIVRCLLTDRDRTWTQAEIVPRTKASSGLVSRIVQHLISQGFVEKTSAREFRLRDWHGLLDEWVESDRFPKRTRTTLYAGFFGPPQELLQRLQQWAKTQSVPLAFTQWIAAWARHPYTEPVVCSAYVARLPAAATLEQLGLRSVTEGGKLWLHVPDDDGVLTETQTCNNLTLVSDAQIYLDLKRTGLRGPDAAAALREWEGFCRP
ncbi:MAG: hypothetical protein NTV80_26135 [Verrucomicrobia bacterium]|nr:hypothetical protein [Verrucomicrobiota bacterium]